MCLLLAAASAGAEPAILAVEPRVGRGVALGGTAGEGHVRWSPLNVGIIAEYAFVADPWVSFYAGPYAEVLDRGALGATAGFRFRPGAGRARLGLGGEALFVPYTLGGATASVGTEIDLLSLPISFDIEGAAYSPAAIFPTAPSPARSASWSAYPSRFTELKPWFLAALLFAGCDYAPDAPCTRHSDCAPGEECSPRGHCQETPDAGADASDGGGK